MQLMLFTFLLYDYLNFSRMDTDRILTTAFISFHFLMTPLAWLLATGLLSVLFFLYFQFTMQWRNLNDRMPILYVKKNLIYILAVNANLVLFLSFFWLKNESSEFPLNCTCHFMSLSDYTCTPHTQNIYNYQSCLFHWYWRHELSCIDYQSSMVCLSVFKILTGK